MAHAYLLAPPNVFANSVASYTGCFSVRTKTYASTPINLAEQYLAQILSKLESK